MGAPAVRTRSRPAARPRPRPATKPRPAKPRAATAQPKSKTKGSSTKASSSRTSAGRSAALRAPRRARHTPAVGFAMIPVAAVGRTAGAVSGLADCGVVVGMTRGRAWIVVLGILLGGIVALNVWGLGMSASSSATTAKVGELQRNNSVLRGRLARQLSNGRIEASAAELGLAVAAPDQVHYLELGENDAERAAERLANEKILPTPPAAPEAVEVEPVEPLTTDPATVDPAVTDSAVVDPAVVDPAAVDPVTGEPVVAEPVTDPAATAPVDPATVDPATGGVAVAP